MIHRDDIFYTSGRLSKRMAAFVFPYEKSARLQHDREVYRNSWTAISRLSPRSKTSFTERTKDIFPESVSDGLLQFWKVGRLRLEVNEHKDSLVQGALQVLYINCIYFCNLIIQKIVLFSQN